MDLKKVQIILKATLYILVGVVFGVGFVLQKRGIMLVAGILASVIWVIACRKFWRCPHCGGILPVKGDGSYKCPHCEKNLGVKVSI